VSSALGSRGDGAVSLSIVVCTRDRYGLLRGCIGAIERQSLDADQFELIVVDN
jgi:glycosyltransferase involved in cell wall biosynthesis